jgi:protein-S-isoprenylcysteine O-methyltransferase Ste14
MSIEPTVVTPGLSQRVVAREKNGVLGLLYSVASYCGFLTTFAYLTLFSDGILVPKSVDTGPSHGLTSTLAIDLGLLLLFGVQHSVMARARFKRALTRIAPAHLERATFVLASSLVLILLMWLWRPLPRSVWNVENVSWATTLWVINAVGWLGVPVCSYMIDHFDLFGIKQPWHRFRRVSLARKGFVTPLLYKYVRHPMMTSLLLALWVTPSMTVGHMLLSLGMSLYIMVGVHFEERALRDELGADYVRYQASTPKFLPVGVRRADAIDRSSAIQ